MLPRLLVIDDLFGRIVADGRNADRDNLCAHFLWRDVTGDMAAATSRQRIDQPTAEAVFCRAQSPADARVGDWVQNDVSAAIETVRSGWFPAAGIDTAPPTSRPATWSMVLLDLCFYTGRVTAESHRRSPGMPEGRPEDEHPQSYFGLMLLEVLHREFPELPLFVLSSKPRAEVSLEFSRRGALGFIDRSVADGPEHLERALWNHGLIPDHAGEVVGGSLRLLLALREARRSACHRENILILGERGSGKELAARFINRSSAGAHERESGRSLRSLTTVNSAVLTPALFASELFGIEPRTATAVDAKIGLIEMANGGDLFLDEIADMATEVQAAMLRVLQDRQITRVGGRRPQHVDVRFLSATNVDLTMPERGFRSDLLDRLRIGGTIWLPSLRDRVEDIPLLVGAFVREAERMRPGIRRRHVTTEAMQALLRHPWPGNIRELRSVMFDAVSRHPDIEHLVPAHLRFEAHTRPSSAELPAVGSPRPRSSAAVFLDVGEVLAAMAACRFDESAPTRWSGRLPELRRQQALMNARLLYAALQATKRKTPNTPDGAIQIHPAAKLATGDAKLTASRAADLFKRLLGPLEDELEGDLRQAYNIAVRLRPRSASPSRRQVSHSMESV